MTAGDFNAKLDELDHLLNDPDVPMQPSRVWALLAEVSVEPASPPTPAPVASSPTAPST